MLLFRVLFRFLFPIILCFFFVLFPVQSVEGQGAQPWRVASYVWNQRLNLWGRTSCLLPITLPAVSGLTLVNKETVCVNYTTPTPVGGEERKSEVLYYHDTDPAGGEDYGKITGRAWSPVYGVISFVLSDFPNTPCYGLSGDDRQPRIVKSDSSVFFKGCAYSPLLREYILFNKGEDATGVPSGWSGVAVSVEEDASRNVCSSSDTDVDCFVKVPYLKLNGCAWSSKSGYWAFGPNQAGSQNTKDNCLPSSHQYTLDSSGVGSAVVNPITINSLQSSVNIGQLVRYIFNCKSGYSSPVRIEILNDFGDVVKTILTPSSPYSQIALSSVARIRLVCADSRGIFPTVQKFDGAGVTSDSILIPLFKVSPSVVTDGGFVTISWEASNRGIFSDNNARCSVTNVLTGAVESQFPVDSLSVSGSINRVVVRDTVFRLQCFHDVMSDNLVVEKKGGVYDVAVKVLPSVVVERNISGSVGLPVFQLSDQDIRMFVPSGAYEVYLYALGSGESVGGRTLHTVVVDRGEARSDSVETDAAIKSRLFGDSLGSDVSVVFTSTDSVTIPISSLSGSALIAEARTFDGRWSEKSVYVLDFISCEARGLESWSVGTRSCQGVVSGAAHGKSSTAENTREGTTGRLTYVCNNGTWKEEPTEKTCFARCATRIGELWSIGTRSCQGVLSGVAHGESSTAEDMSGTIGAVTYTCNDGTWDEPTEKTCFAQCATVGEQRWSAGTRSCQGILSGVVHGESSTAEDMSGTVGAVTYACNNGTWKEEPTGKTCFAQCAARAEESWSVGVHTCRGIVSGVVHGESSTAENTLGKTAGRLTYTCNDGTWDGPTEEACYLPVLFARAATLSNHDFSDAVAAVSSGGDTLVARTQSSGTDIFTRSNNTWSLQRTISDTSSGGSFGSTLGAVSLSSDGNTLVAGADYRNYGTGALRVFTRSGTDWSLQRTIDTNFFGVPWYSFSDTRFGLFIALSSDGNTLVSGTASGTMYILSRSGATWSHQQTIDDRFSGFLLSGGAITASLSSDGNTLAAGVTNANSSRGAVHIFTRSGTTWSHHPHHQTIDRHFSGLSLGISHRLGLSVQLSSDGNTLAAGSDGVAVHIFTRSGTTWSHQQTIDSSFSGLSLGSGSEFGKSLALSSDGNTLAVGAGGFDSGKGAVYNFSRSGTAWVLKQTIDDGFSGVSLSNSDSFGHQVALSPDGNTLTVISENNSTLYVFTR